MSLSLSFRGSSFSLHPFRSCGFLVFVFVVVFFLFLASFSSFFAVVLFFFLQFLLVSVSVFGNLSYHTIVVT